MSCTVEKWTKDITDILNGNVEIEETVLCSKTGTELFNFNNLSKKITLHTSCGFCSECNQPFHESELIDSAFKDPGPRLFQSKSLVCKDCNTALTTNPF